ncbi:MAG TPA: branched-chain amino acid aminotransferase [Candidatus Nanoarchaeia archaeon]|nr:branched-chain amino acid aminotransferase [Candidatus Nanoarchaeia archaeon]
MNIDYRLKPRAQRLRDQLHPNADLPFGSIPSDHIFLMDYANGTWGNARIVPDGSLEAGGIPLSMTAIALGYAQSVFEGAKAFRHPDGEVYLFRFDENANRMNRSADRMCLPQIPLDLQLEAAHALVDVDRLWLPEREGHSLYLRPQLFGTESSAAVRSSVSHTFGITLFPSGPYFPGGFGRMISLWITDQFHRAVPGGTGGIKASANYGPCLYPQRLAKERYGCAQVLYLDVTNTFIEEAGAMNHYHVTADGAVVIPTFTDTILPSITARSVLELLAEGRIPGLRGDQRHIPINEFIAHVRRGKITEAGGFGTAAVVAPVEDYALFDCGDRLPVQQKAGPQSKAIYDLLTGIQSGIQEPPLGWLQKVERRETQRAMSRGLSVTGKKELAHIITPGWRAGGEGLG